MLIDVFCVKQHFYRPRNVSIGVFWGAESEFEIKNDEKLPADLKK